MSTDGSVTFTAGSYSGSFSGGFNVTYATPTGFSETFSNSKTYGSGSSATTVSTSVTITVMSKPAGSVGESIGDVLVVGGGVTVAANLVGAAGNIVRDLFSCFADGECEIG